LVARLSRVQRVLLAALLVFSVVALLGLGRLLVLGWALRLVVLVLLALLARARVFLRGVMQRQRRRDRTQH
jgi:hypothetical protein